MVPSLPESFLPQVTTLASLALSAGAPVSGAHPVFKGIHKTSLHGLNYWADLLCSWVSPPWTEP